VGNLNITQIEQLREIGAQLHQLREEQARPLEDIAAKTYIPLRLLRAIEEGREQPLPEPVFVQGFIRRYAEALGLDGMAIAKQFSLQTSPAPQDMAAETAVSTLPERPPQPRRVEYDYRPEPKPESTRSAHAAPPAYLIPAIVGGVIILGALIFAVSRLSTRSPDSEQTVSSQAVAPSAPSPAASPSPSAPAATAPVASPSLSAVASPSPASPSPAATGAISASLNLTGDSWMQITVDGETQFEGILPSGTQRSWSGQSSIIVVAGNAGAVSLSTNNQPAQPMGEPGAVERVTITANSPQDQPSN
jgi:cytoskeleton protein RodZ